MYEFTHKVRQAFHLLGFDLRYYQDSEESIVGKLLACSKPVAVLDVGANTGHYARMLRSIGYGGVIVSFEPLRTAHAKLVARARGNGRWIVAPRVALGSTKGSIDINVAGNSVSSSILAMNETHLAAAPKSRYVATETVALERLDELLPTIFSSPGSLLLKMDTQGYEAEVLKGAEAILPRVTAIQMEISLVPLYGQTATLMQTLSVMKELGFELFQVIPGFQDGASGQLLQLDGIFVRQLPSAT